MPLHSDHKKILTVFFSTMGFILASAVGGEIKSTHDKDQMKKNDMTTQSVDTGVRQAPAQTLDMN